MSKNDKQTERNHNQGPDGRFIQGNTAGLGRIKGSLNKATKDKREWVNKLIDDNKQEIEEALKQQLADNPDKALKHLLGLIDYTTPKLARTELTGPDDGPVTLYMVDRIKDPEADNDEE